MTPTNTVTVNDFVPYTEEDIVPIILHCDNMPRRWEWFWPQFRATTPPQVVANSIVVYHNRFGKPLEIPQGVQAVQEVATLVVLDKEGASIVWPFLEGLKHTKARLVARIANDVEILSPAWVDLALQEFNKEPHLKILASIATPGPTYEATRTICYAPWLFKLLHDGQYTDMSYIHGSVIIANRAIWLAYYADLMLDYTIHGGEDIFFTLWSRADGVEVVPFGHFFRHRGPSNQDRIV
jgi:hypothetical protein